MAMNKYLNASGGNPADQPRDNVSAATLTLDPQALRNGGAQQINLAVNNAPVELGTGEWIKRGLLRAAGDAVSWPAKAVARLIEKTASAIVSLFKWAIMIVTAPTLMMIGCQYQQKVAEAPSIEAGAQSIMHDGRHALNGMGKGVTDKLPPERPRANPPTSQ